MNHNFSSNLDPIKLSEYNRQKHFCYYNYSLKSGVPDYQIPGVFSKRVLEILCSSAKIKRSWLNRPISSMTNLGTLAMCFRPSTFHELVLQ